MSQTIDETIDFPFLRVLQEPNWRLLRATEVFEASKAAKINGKKRFQVSKWKEGRAVAEYVGYLRAYDRAPTRLKRRQSFIDKYWHFEQAKAIFANDVQRLEIELRIIAGQSLEFIATRMQFKFETVRTYCCYYFDLRHPRDKDRFRDHVVYDLRGKPLACEEPNTWNREEFGRFLRMYAFKTSNLMISILIDAYIHLGEKHNLKTPDGFNRKHVENRYQLLRLPSGPNFATYSRSLAVLEYQKRTSSVFESDFATQCEATIAENIMDLASKIRAPFEDYDAVAPRRSPKTVFAPQLPSLTVFDSSATFEQTVATSNAEASNAA